MKKLVLVDGNSLLFRSYYATAYAGANIMRNHEGIPTNALFGFAHLITKLVTDVKPDYIMVAFDAGKKTFRHQEFDIYKAGRRETPEELKVQFPIVREYLDLAGIKRYEIAGYEADDIIATAARIGQDNNLEVEVYTSDKDLLQTIDKNVKVCLTKKGVTDIEYMDEKALFEKYSLTPSQIPDLKGLMGDPSDNIPGVNGIGEKTAIKLLGEFGTVEGIYENLNSIKGSTHDKLEKDKDMAFLSKKVATIYRDVALPFTIPDLANHFAYSNELNNFFIKYDMKSFVQKAEIKVDKTNLFINEKLPNEIYKKDISIIVHTDNPNYHLANVLGFSISDGTNAYYVDKNIALSDDRFINMLKDPAIKKTGYDVKEFINALVKYDIRVDGFNFDSVIAGYLIDPNLPRDIHKLFNKYGYNLPFIDKKSSIEDVCTYYNLLALYNYKIKDSLIKEMHDNELDKLFYDIELPLVFVLAKMERIGVKVDASVLDEIGDEYKKKLDEIEDSIYRATHLKFNVSSPKQVAEVLFDNLGLPANKKRSTSSEELEKIKNFHPVIPLILEYRKYSKIVSTYIDGIEPFICKDGLVHTIYNQTNTLTGRLSSSEPNLQNISVRDEIGKEIRKAFVVRDENNYFLSLDYSQVELRVLASISKDQNMIDSFKQGVDIHTLTAMNVFGVSKDEVTQNQRRSAKAINFGIVYGISDWGLAEQLGVSPAFAKEFINRYFEAFPGIKKYLDDVVAKAAEDGYVTTLLNRKRYIEELSSPTYMIREFGKRVAMNTPIQGTAADIIKIAMINVSSRLKVGGFKTRMIMQVHDELIFEVPKDELNAIIPIIQEEMENAFPLDVPLVAEYGYGDNWFNTK